jgi:hypothetical protein
MENDGQRTMADSLGMDDDEMAQHRLDDSEWHKNRKFKVRADFFQICVDTPQKNHPDRIPDYVWAPNANPGDWDWHATYTDRTVVEPEGTFPNRVLAWNPYHFPFIRSIVQERTKTYGPQNILVFGLNEGLIIDSLVGSDPLEVGLTLVDADLWLLGQKLERTQMPSGIPILLRTGHPEFFFHRPQRGSRWDIILDMRMLHLGGYISDRNGSFWKAVNGACPRRRRRGHGHTICLSMGPTSWCKPFAGPRWRSKYCRPT